MNSALPGHLHVNGVDHKPWFADDTFSAKALAAQKFPVMHCYPWWTGALKYGGPMDPPSIKLLAAMAALPEPSRSPSGPANSTPASKNSQMPSKPSGSTAPSTPPSNRA